MRQISGTKLKNLFSFILILLVTVEGVHHLLLNNGGPGNAFFFQEILEKIIINDYHYIPGE